MLAEVQVEVPAGQLCRQQPEHLRVVLGVQLGQDDGLGERLRQAGGRPGGVDEVAAPEQPGRGRW
ncbi:hypothetical protein ABZ747_26425 [Kitasatospora cineracea]|uniref:hypothetical protein n=1 Tax=Kitasatospora cineracea TaxID=88074 RepID=UPI0033E9EBCD